MRKMGLAVALLVSQCIAPAAWAVLAKLASQELRQTASGTTVLVCIYEAAGRKIERIYPAGNFCPQYVDD